MRAVVALAAAGCAADATGGSGSPSASTETTAPADAQGTVLASITLAEGHFVRFLEVSAGTLVVTEEGDMSQRPVLGTTGGSILDVYRTLAKGAEPPTALADAEARRLAIVAVTPVAAPIAPPPVRSHLQPEDGTPVTGTDQWFKSAFCNNYYSVDCEFGNNQDIATYWPNTDPYTGYNSHLRNMYGYAFNQGTYNATMYINRWNGSWAHVYAGATSPGRWLGTASWTTGPSYFQVEETSTGGDSGVDIWGYSPKFDGAWYGNGQIGFNGEQFVNDSAVTVTVSSGSLHYQLPGPSNGNFPVGSNGNFYSGGTNTYCSPYSWPATWNATLTVVGVNTGQTATTTVSIYGCEL